MPENALLFHTDSRGIATLTLNRPEISNAFDDVLIARMNHVLAEIAEDDSIRFVILNAAGKHFSAGGDVNWMRRKAQNTREENEADARQLAELMRRLHFLPQPTIAVVQGAAFGGGVGLVACCDIAIASTAAVFCLSEVKLGFVPAVISPYVVSAIGPRNATRYFLTAERFDAGEAHRIGLVHQVVDPYELETRKEETIQFLLQGGPKAQRTAKRLIGSVTHRPIDDTLVEDLAKLIAAMRASDEGKEGMAAFLEKRKPAWAPKNSD